MRARLIDATVEPLWRHVSLDVADGEMIAILGPNGSGKSTLLNTLAGIRPLKGGRVEVTGRLGYIPQQRMFPPDLPLRARDLVSLSLGHGVVRNRWVRRRDVDKLLARVGAAHLADARVGRMSGGQQQLVRQAQALANNPQLLLADEPFLSLDVARQRDTVARFCQLQAGGTAIVLVTHSIDPIVDVVDRILYIGPRGHVLGTVDEVLTSDVLSELYGAPIDVVRVHGKTVIV